MCGIGGRYNYGIDAPVDRGVIDAMCSILAHRGPDGEGRYIEGPVGLGHRRLSIIDLSQAGAQPMFNEDGSVAIVFNGEIYNYRELKNDLEANGHRFSSSTDTEVIVHAYEEYGAKCVERLNGMFAFAIWDSKIRRLTVARDRLGVKPLYYYSDGKFLSFSSEIKALLVDGDIPVETDIQALANFLTLHYVPGPRTMFKGIKKLLPGRIMAVDKDGLRIERYWRLERNTSLAASIEGMSESELADRIYSELEASVNMRLQSDVPVGAFLSGGLDSSSIVGLMTRLKGGPVDTFTVGYSESGDDGRSEFKWSRRVSKHFGSRNHEVVVDSEKFLSLLPKVVWHQDEPIGEPASVPLFSVARLARERGITVLLSGEGSDELFAGYNRHWGEILSRYYLKVPRLLRDGVLGPAIAAMPRSPLLKKGHRSMSIQGFVPRYMSWHTVFTDEIKSELFTAAEKTADVFEDVFRPEASMLDGLTGLEKILLLDLNVWLADDLLMKKDKMGMAASVEARVPFLDYKFVEFAFQVPEHHKVRRLETKYILKKAMERLLPRDVIYRKKEGFPTPISEWLRGELRDFAMDMLTSDEALGHGLFNKKTVKRLIDEHVHGREDNGRLLFPLINFEVWHRLFFSGVGLKRGGAGRIQSLNFQP